MKKIILFLITIILFSCGNPPVDTSNFKKDIPKDSISQGYKFEENGHDWLRFGTGQNISEIHSPECSCKK